MEAFITVLRPVITNNTNNNSNNNPLDYYYSKELNLNNFEILLDVQKPFKKLLSTSIFLDSEPSNVLCDYLYRFTGGEIGGGIKGKKAVFVPPLENNSDLEDRSLYCISVDSTEVLHNTSKRYFVSLEAVVQAMNNSEIQVSPSFASFIKRLLSWLKGNFSYNGVLNILFSSSSDDRLKWSISNPACSRPEYCQQKFQCFLSPDNHRTPGNNLGACVKNNPGDVYREMVSSDRCEMTKINPLFGYDVSNFLKVDRVVINKYWGCQSQSNNTDHIFNLDPPSNRIWSDMSSIHEMSMTGDRDGILRLIQKKGVNCVQKCSFSNLPIHCSSYYGHLTSVKVLLEEGQCPPNLRNGMGRTALHVASMQGQPDIVRLLVNQKDIDINATDKMNRTALEYCDHVLGDDWQICAKLIRQSMKQEVATIKIYLMDGTTRQLPLTSNVNTTVQQLQSQMMAVLKIPENCSHLFTLWVCSRNLQLQLKPEHKPVQHLNDWKRRIVGMLTDQDPEKEDPELFFKRNAMLTIEKEKLVRNPVAINLLFLEAYHNYIKTLNPCDETDAVVLAGILLQLFFGNNQKICHDHINNGENSLNTLIPVQMFQRLPRATWIKNILDQYKGYSNKFENQTIPMHQFHFLLICWNLTSYGSAFFTGYTGIKSRSKSPIYIGVNDVGLHIISVDTKTMWKSFCYEEMTWASKKVDDCRQELEIRNKNSNKLMAVLLTKQAALVDHLMKRLFNLNRKKS